MYDISKSVIDSGRFELTDMLKKIDTIWIQGDISDEEKEELVALAQEKANPENSFAPLQNQIDLLAVRLASLESTVKNNGLEIQAIQDKMAEEEMPVPEPEPEEPEEYPEYVQPTGGHDAYYKDDKITFEGKKYICIAPEGTPCVWSPKDYPTYWEEIKE